MEDSNKLDLGSPNTPLRARVIAEAWVKRFNDAIKQVDADAVVDCIQEDGWFRDLLTFGWDFRSMNGREAIKSYLKDTLERTQITNVHLDEHFCPREGAFGPTRQLIDAALNFETPRALGKGFVRVTAGDNAGEPLAFGLFMMINDWKGHEERTYESGLYGGHTISYQEVRAARRKEIEESPSVLILGAGQTGLQLAARFKQMNIRALVVEKNARVGDNWRRHYPTLTLHTLKTYSSFLYSPYPSNIPKFIPKDLLATWLEQYAIIQDLVIWTESFLIPTPAYDESTGTWDVTVNKQGVKVHLRPSHIVIATSMHGKPNIPTNLPGESSFEGRILHSTGYKGGAEFSGKKVVVVGVGNTGADVCQDLVTHGAWVTIVQRSPSSVVSDKLVSTQLDPVYPDGQDINYLDLAAFAMPLGAVRMLMREVRETRLGFDKEMREGLEKAGFKLTDGKDGSGQLFLVFEKGGGYFLDVGCARLIIDGQIKVKHGCEITSYKPKHVVFTDGNEVEADAVIYATSWKRIRSDLEELFGKETIDRTSQIWGFDEHGELRIGYRPSGQPGFWYAFGTFDHVRFHSKQLALMIKAVELGYYDQ